MNRLKTDSIDFAVDLDLELVLGDMPQKVSILLQFLIVTS